MLSHWRKRDLVRLRTATGILSAAALLAACDARNRTLPTAPLAAGGAHADHTPTADPTTLWVNHTDSYDPPGSSCAHPDYPTIQAAVDAAAPGDRINVCAGTYVEQVIIPKDNIQLRSVGAWKAVIQAPPVMLPPKAIVLVSGAHDVTILAFTITGPGGGPCDFLEYGVRVDNGGSANILGNHITQIRDEPFSGCQNGVAVQVGRQREGTTGSARIIGNVIDNYQKNGPTVDNVGSYAEIAHNRILGGGPTDVTAQNGVQVSRGATANVHHNFVSGNIYTPQAVEATGILLYQSGVVATEHNSVSANDGDIYMYQAAAGSTTPYNLVRASTFDGITLDFAPGNQVANNKTTQNGGPGIGLYDDSRNNILQNNVVDGNSDSGILLDVASNNTVAQNEVMNNGTAGPDVTDGIRVNSASTGNTIQHNQLRNNVTHDCHDNTLVPLNSWVDNHGGTSFPAGLCGGGNATFNTSTVAYGWDPSYAWYDEYGVTGDYDWTSVYSTIDTDALLQLLPSIRLNGVRRAAASPNP